MVFRPCSINVRHLRFHSLSLDSVCHVAISPLLCTLIKHSIFFCFGFFFVVFRTKYYCRMTHYRMLKHGGGGGVCVFFFRSVLRVYQMIASSYLVEGFCAPPTFPSHGKCRLCYKTAPCARTIKSIERAKCAQNKK